MSDAPDVRDAWIQRVLGVNPRDDNADPDPPDSIGTGNAMQAWQAERAQALTALRAISGEIAKSEDPEARDAIILLQAIAKNLTASPASLQAVLELQRYLEQDDIIEDAEQPNPFGIELNLRGALLPALAELRKVYEAAQT